MALAGFGLFFDNYDSATTTQRANDNRSESVRESKLPSSERVAQRQRESRAADAPRMAANARKRPS